MKAAQLLLAALAMAALLAVPAAAQVPASMSTKGMRYKGYTFSTDVSSLWRLDIDFCQIFGAMFGPPSDVPRDIFYNGTAAFAPLSFAALVRNEANRGDPMWNILFNSRGGYSSPQDILDAMDSAFATNNPIRFLQVGLSLVKGKIMLDFLDQAIRGIKSNSLVQRNLDSAWALLAGNPNLGGCPDSLLFIVEEFAVAFNNDYRGVPTDELYLARVFGDAQAQSKNPKNLTAARAAVTRASLAIVSTYTEFLLQLANYYGASIDVAHACGRMDMLPLALQQNELFLPITKAFASGLGAPSDALAALEAAVNANAGYNVTSAAVQRVASSINIVMTYGGRPNTEGIKMLWLNDRIDLSNCTAI